MKNQKYNKILFMPSSPKLIKNFYSTDPSDQSKANVKNVPDLN
jgi:hypothetical protein